MQSRRQLIKVGLLTALGLAFAPATAKAENAAAEKEDPQATLLRFLKGKKSLPRMSLHAESLSGDGVTSIRYDFTTEKKPQYTFGSNTARDFVSDRKLFHLTADYTDRTETVIIRYPDETHDWEAVLASPNIGRRLLEGWQREGEYYGACS